MTITANEVVNLLKTIKPEPQVEVLDMLYELKDACKESPFICKSSNSLKKHNISLRSSADRIVSKVEALTLQELQVLREDLDKLVKRFGLV